ncbi:MAG: hypothetical protein ACJKSS_02770 [Patescibacteria group bacterium UBA2103]
MKNTLQYWSKYLRAGALLGVLLIGAVSVASFTNPTTDPTGGNIAAPVNKSSFSQEKSGNLAAASLGAGTVSASNLFCLGADNCISDWWESGTLDYAQVCLLERVGVFPPANTNSPNMEGYQDYCNGQLTSAARADGWVPVSSDACSEDRGNCTTDGVACMFIRLSCDDQTAATSIRKIDQGQAVFEALYGGGSGGGDNNSEER